MPCFPFPGSWRTPGPADARCRLSRRRCLSLAIAASECRTLDTAPRGGGLPRRSRRHRNGPRRGCESSTVWWVRANRRSRPTRGCSPRSGSEAATSPPGPGVNTSPRLDEILGQRGHASLRRLLARLLSAGCRATGGAPTRTRRTPHSTARADRRWAVARFAQRVSLPLSARSIDAPGPRVILPPARIRRRARDAPADADGGAVPAGRAVLRSTPPRGATSTLRGCPSRRCGA